MEAYHGYSRSELIARKQEIDKRFEEYKKQNLNLDMSRGKPCKEQLDLCDGLFDNVDSLITKNGVDCRNYGGLDGIPEAKKLFSEMLSVNPSEIIVGDNSSLNMMYDTISRAYNHGLYKSPTPWSRLNKVKFLCPSPGYDRHFAISELFGMEMITVPMKNDGPDMDMVEELAASDDSVKGIWCVPKYSNPTGASYSDDVIVRLASMKTKAKDFRIFWDNAYLMHHLTEEPEEILNILRVCEKNGNPNRVFIFASTSKISFPGAGIAMLAASADNIRHILKLMSIQTIGPNKINQLLHVRFFKCVEGINEHMKKQAEILKPKFETVLSIFNDELSGKGIAAWTEPKGGYFISLDVKEGCAGEVVSMAQQAGVKLTKAGATYPYGKDPKDINIRIAPTFPALDELTIAIRIVCVCIERVTLAKLLKV